MLVDTGAAVNLMPYSVLRRLGRSSADLIKTNVMLNDFNGQPSEAMGVLNVELTVDRKTIPTSFLKVIGCSSLRGGGGELGTNKNLDLWLQLVCTKLKLKHAI